MATVGGTNRDLYIDDTGKIGYVPSLKNKKIWLSDLNDAEWIYSLFPKTFKFKKKVNGKETEEPTGPVQYGLFAEDVEIVNPEICFYDLWTTDTEGQKLAEPVKQLAGVNYSQLIIPIMVELKKVRAEVIKIKGEKAALASQVELLQADIDKIKAEKAAEAKKA